MASCCNVCCVSYNKSSRAQVKCCFEDCDFDACKSCVRKYLLSTTKDPHCMNCKKAWNQDFMTMNLNRSFIAQEYKQARMDVLLDAEMSKMPQTMEAAQREKKTIEKRKEMHGIENQIYTLNEQIKQLVEAKAVIRMDIYNLHNNSEKNASEKRKFIMPCPGNDCRGFLNTQYKCEMCNMHTCSKCLVLIGPNKNVEHVCNEDMVKSAELIKKETKPCPACGTRISKISGCNQMWCTNCHIAFSWTSGVIDNGPVHNPHFYEFQKTTHGGVAPRNPGDIVCGGMCNYMTLRSRLSSKSFYYLNKTNQTQDNCYYIKNLLSGFYALHRIGVHISEVSLPYYREQARDIDHNEGLRVQYILQNKTKEELRTTVYKRDYVRQKNKEILHILELVGVTLIEIFVQIVNSKNDGHEFIAELEQHHINFMNLGSYANEQLENVSISYNRSVPTIVFREPEQPNFRDWLIEHHKSYNYSNRIKKYKDEQNKNPLAASEN